MGRAGAPGSARKSACPVAARCGRGTGKKSAAPVPPRRRRPTTASFRRRLIELLLHPDTVRVQLESFRQRLPRLGVLILLTQAYAEPQVSLCVLRIELDRLPKVRG